MIIITITIMIIIIIVIIIIIITIIIIIPMALKYRDEIQRGIVKLYRLMKCSLALVGNHLEMVPRWCLDTGACVT